MLCVGMADGENGIPGCLHVLLSVAGDDCGDEFVACVAVRFSEADGKEAFADFIVAVQFP